MQSLNKKGISEIVQIVSIIALSIIALGTVGSYVLNLSSKLDSTLSPIVDCVQLQTRITNACVNQEGTMEVTIDKPATDNLNEVFLTGENGFKTSCGGDCSTCTLQTNKIFLEDSGLTAGNKIFLTTEVCQNPISETTINLC